MKKNQRKSMPNKVEFKHIIDDIDISYERSLERISEYIDKNPRNYSAYLVYADLLIVLGKTDKAKEVIEFVEKAIPNASRYRSSKPKKDVITKKIISARSRILIAEGKYEEFLDYMSDNYDLITLYRMRFYEAAFNAKIMTNRMPEIPDKYKNNYIMNQMFDYSEERFMEHIAPHLSIEERETTPVASYFNGDFPLKEVLNYIKSNLDKSKALFISLNIDTYYFKYDFCGRVDNKVTDYFKLDVIHDSDKLINIHPCLNGELMPHTDLNNINIQAKPNVMRKSRIDKFNEKYGIKQENVI